MPCTVAEAPPAEGTDKMILLHNIYVVKGPDSFSVGC